MEVFPAYPDSKNAKKYQNPSVFGFPYFGPYFGPHFPFVGCPYFTYFPSRSFEPQFELASLLSPLAMKPPMVSGPFGSAIHKAEPMTMSGRPTMRQVPEAGPIHTKGK